MFTAQSTYIETNVPRVLRTSDTNTRVPSRNADRKYHNLK